MAYSSFVSFFFHSMEEEQTNKEAADFNLAGNCAFKDKEYEKAIRFYNYVFSFNPLSHT